MRSIRRSAGHAAAFGPFRTPRAQAVWALDLAADIRRGLCKGYSRAQVVEAVREWLTIAAGYRRAAREVLP